MIVPIIFDIDSLEDNGFNCYLKGRSYDLQENWVEYSAENAVKYYKKGYYEFKDKMCQYSIAISNYLGDFDYLFDDNDKKILFPTFKEIEELSTSENKIVSIYAKFILAAYYNYGLAGVEKDEDKAFEIIYECALNGHIGAMYDLGAKDKFKSRIENSEQFLIMASDNGSIRAKEHISNYKKH